MQRNRWLIGLIAICTLGFLVLDWTRLAVQPTDATVGPVSNGLKAAVSFLAATIAWRARGRGHSPTDENRFRIIFGLVVAADICLILQRQLVGILLFAAVQVLLIERNLTGWRGAGDSLREDRWRLIAIGLAVTAISGACAVWIYTVQGVTLLLVVSIIYLVLLTASVVAAQAAVTIGHFSPASSRLMAIGLVCFLICDLTVGGNLVLPTDSVARIVTTSSTWIFYTPALVLIALSAYKTPLSTTIEPDQTAEYAK